uniref:COR domain-containing protein n=1 Tax=Macrostomum lignano TaxID=282301 RepID=A0A1I8IDV7_9PLAT
DLLSKLSALAIADFCIFTSELQTVLRPDPRWLQQVLQQLQPDLWPVRCHGVSGADHRPVPDSAAQVGPLDASDLQSVARPPQTVEPGVLAADWVRGSRSSSCSVNPTGSSKSRAPVYSSTETLSRTLTLPKADAHRVRQGSAVRFKSRLIVWHVQAVAHGDALQVDEAGPMPAVDDGAGQQRDVDPRVALSRDVEGPASVLGEQAVEVEQRSQVQPRGRVIVELGRVGGSGLAQADTAGRVDVQHVGQPVPREVVALQLGAVVRQERPVRHEQATDRGAAGTAVHPQHERSRRGVHVGALDQPVEEAPAAAAAAAGGQVARVLGEVRAEQQPRQLLDAASLALGESAAAEAERQAQNGPHGWRIQFDFFG